MKIDEFESTLKILAKFVLSNNLVEDLTEQTKIILSDLMNKENIQEESKKTELSENNKNN